MITSTILFPLMGKIALVILLGFILAKLNIISESLVKFLNKFVLNFTLPCLILFSFLKEVKHDFLPNIFYLLSSFILALLSFAIGLLLLKLFRIKSWHRECLVTIVFQNAGYLPLALIDTIFPENVELFRAIFFYLIGFNILLFSWGVYLLKEKFYFKSIVFNPVIITSTIGILLFFNKAAYYTPISLLQFLKLSGEPTIFLSLFLLGTFIANVDFQPFAYGKQLMVIIIAKLIVIPAAILLIVFIFSFKDMMRFFLLLESSMPSAVFLSLLTSKNNLGQIDIITQAIVATHILSLITIPLFLSWG